MTESTTPSRSCPTSPAPSWSAPRRCVRLEGGRCSIGRFGGTPAPGDCRACDDYLPAHPASADVSGACGVYSTIDSNGRRLFFRLTAGYAQTRPQYTFVRPVDCSARIRIQDGEEDRAGGLGDLIADGIKVATLGLLPPCAGCEERRQAINRMVPFGAGGTARGT